MGAKGKILEPGKVVEKLDVNYREIVGAINQSSLKIYRDDPMDFYEQFVLGRKKKEKDTFATLVGSVAEFLLLECECNEVEFESKAGDYFVMFNGVKGSGQSFLLADYLFEETEMDTGEDGECHTSFIDRFNRALARCQAEDKFKGKTVDWAIEDFEKKGKNGEESAADYFSVRMRGLGKKVIDDKVVAKAKEVAEMLKNDEFTRGIFNNEDGFVQRMVKFPVVWKYSNGIECRSEFDQFCLNEIDGVAWVDDLKCTYDNEEFAYSYLKYGYYLQNAFYISALRWWLDNNGMKDFQILGGLRFIGGDTSKNKRRPLVYSTYQEDIDAGNKGFKIRGVEYKGVGQLMNEVAWAMDKGIFNVSKSNYENKGQIKLEIPYE